MRRLGKEGYWRKEQNPREKNMNLVPFLIGFFIVLEFEEFFKLLPKESRFWHYRGGLTTPVCTEAVNWYINKNII